MKRFFTLLLAVLINSLFAQDVCKTLFVGNSYTSVNNLPQTVYQLALSAGDTLIYDSSAPGGCTFAQHLNLAATTSRITAGGWDFVVLQEQSQYPSFPIEQVEAEVFPYAAQLSDLIRANNPEGEVVFYMTWGRKNGDAYNCPNYPPLCTYEGMDSLLYHRYLMMAELNNAAVSPVGAVWHYLRDNHPEIELYDPDESHPSKAGTYAAAATFYTILFKKNPTRITDNQTLDADVAQVIREAAETVAFDSLARWYQYVTVNIPQYSNESVNIFPNPCNSYINIVSPSLQHGTSSIRIYNSIGSVVKQIQVAPYDNVQIPTAELSRGCYFLEISSSDCPAVRKTFIKN